MSDDLVKELAEHSTMPIREWGNAAIARIEALEAELQGARADARKAIADAYRMGQEAHAAAIEAALAELDASPFTNAEHQRAKDILRAAREATK